MWSTLSKRRGRGKGRTVLCLLLGSLTLTGCAFGKGLFSDSGADVVLVPDASQYLDLKALEEKNQQSEDTWNGYQVYTLSCGNFTTATPVLRAGVSLSQISTVKAQVQEGTMKLREMVVERNAYVHEGDVIARVSMETDELVLEELELRLDRLKKRYTKEAQEYAQSHEEAVENISDWPNQGKIDRLNIEQTEADFFRKSKEYEEQIAEYEKSILEQQEMAQTTEILAPEEGFVLEVRNIQAGEVLSDGQVLAVIAPADQITLEVEDQLSHYGYGVEMTLTAGTGIQARQYPVTVSSASGKMLSGDWNKHKFQVMGDYTAEEILGNGPFNLSGYAAAMENVLLVPTRAVTVEKQKCYVTVLHEDNTLEKTQFIAGGNNGEYYWVFDGLTAGTRVVIQ